MLGSLFHASAPPYLQGQVALGQTVALRLRADRDLDLLGIFLRTAPEGEQVMTPARRAGQEGCCQWWEVEVELTVPRLAYRFLVQTDQGAWWLSAAGLTRHTPTDATDFKLLPAHPGPDWVPEAVFYQIFPDRFADGDPASNVRDGEYLLEGRPVMARRWEDAPTPGAGAREFYGGDLPGIVDHLDHLQDLGIDALYLNPVFTAPSSHKYDVADYEHVDPHLGGDQALIDLRRALDDRGMRLVLDVVPNHCGVEHPWFRKAQADPDSPEAGFFTFHSHPHDYACWLGHRSLPRLNYRDPLLVEAMVSGQDSVLRRWLRAPFSLDGWRLDVANMLARQGASQLGHKVGRAIRRAVKAENPHAWILGEHFFDGTAHLQGDELDGVMNYRGFMVPLWQWLVGSDLAGFEGKPWGDRSLLPTASLAAQWMAFRSAVPESVGLQHMNLLGSHDTPRILDLAGGDRRVVQVAAALLFTWPGSPCLFYGDEVGLGGGGEPEGRIPMPWDPSRWDLQSLEFFRRLCRLRRGSQALTRGALQVLLAEGGTLAFLRESPGQRVVVVACRAGASGQVRALPVRHGGIPDGTLFRAALGGGLQRVREGRLEGMPAAPGAEIWIEERA
jgi:alpha-glucosidase